MSLEHQQVGSLTQLYSVLLFQGSHSGLSIIDHVSVLENFDGLKNHFLVMQHIVRYINIHTNEIYLHVLTFLKAKFKICNPKFFKKTFLC